MSYVEKLDTVEVPGRALKRPPSAPQDGLGFSVYSLANVKGILRCSSP